MFELTLFVKLFFSQILIKTIEFKTQLLFTNLFPYYINIYCTKYQLSKINYKSTQKYTIKFSKQSQKDLNSCKNNNRTSEIYIKKITNTIRNCLIKATKDVRAVKINISFFV